MGDLEPPASVYTTKRYLRYNKTLQNFLETPLNTDTPHFVML